eukprot:95383_1
MTLWDPATNLEEGIRWVSVISCLLSIFGSIFIILIYCAYPSLRKPARRLLLWLSVTDLGTALSYMITILGCYNCKNCSSNMQLLFTISGVFWPVSSFLWTDCIAVYVFGASYQKQWINSTKKLFTSFHIISWIIPFILILILIILFYTNAYNIQFSSKYTGGWCWTNTFALHLISGKAIEIFSYIFLFILYCSTYVRMHEIKKFKRESLLDAADRVGPKDSINTTKVNELLTRFSLIPLIFIILRSFGTLRVIFVAVGVMEHNSPVDQALQIGQAFCDPLQGFCNAVLFLLCVSAVRVTVFNIQDNTRFRHKITTTTNIINTTKELNKETHTITSLSSINDTNDYDL